MQAGGVVAYPTEGVYGLGCLPDNVTAVRRILSIKKRDAAMGLILIAAKRAQIEEWAELPDDAELSSSLQHPITWIVPAKNDVPFWIRGVHAGIAVRITAHPVARALCESTDSALVSTSANLSGRPPARNIYVLRRMLGHLVDYVVPGDCGPASSHSEIRELHSGRIVRAAN
jgi:L-threonylcarbamoyladenylate synthase